MDGAGQGVLNCKSYGCSKEGKILKAGRVTEGFLEEALGVLGLVADKGLELTDRNNGMWLGAFHVGSDTTKKANDGVVDFLERVHRPT